MRIFVVIKGDRVAAQVAAQARGLAFEFSASNASQSETYGHCAAKDRAAIIQWYAEDSGIAVEEYARGSLLWYAYRD